MTKTGTNHVINGGRVVYDCLRVFRTAPLDAYAIPIFFGWHGFPHPQLQSDLIAVWTFHEEAPQMILLGPNVKRLNAALVASLPTRREWEAERQFNWSMNTSIRDGQL